MKRTHIFLAGLIAVAAVMFSGLVAHPSQGPPGQAILSHDAQLLNSGSFPAPNVIVSQDMSQMLATVWLFMITFSLASFALILMKKLSTAYRELQTFFSSHVHNSRLRSSHSLA